MLLRKDDADGSVEGGVDTAPGTDGDTDTDTDGDTDTDTQSGDTETATESGTGSHMGDAGVDGGRTHMDSDIRNDTDTETATHGDTGGDTGTNTGGGSDTDADTGTISDTDIGPLPLPEIQSPREDDIFRTDEAVEVACMVSADAVAVQVSVNGGAIHEASTTGDTFTVTLPAPQPEGVLVISVTARDGLGMTSGAATINPIAWD